MKRLFIIFSLITLFEANINGAENNKAYEQEQKEKGEAESQNVTIHISPELQAQIQNDPAKLNCLQEFIKKIKTQPGLIAKAIAYRFFAIGGGFAWAYYFTHNPTLSIQIVSGTSVVSTVLYFTWDNIWKSLITDKGYKKLLCCKKKDDNNNDKQDPANNV